FFFKQSRPDIILPKLLPKLCASVEHLVTDDIVDDEDLDKTLLFHLLLLSYIMESIGSELLKYRPEVESMLKAALKLNGKKGYGLASVILTRLLNSLTFIYPIENKLADVNFDDPNYLAFEDWGKHCHWKDTKINWHTPSVDELTWAKDIFLDKFVQFSKDFENISSLSESSEALNKSLLKRMQLLQASYDGISVILPFWNDTPIVPHDSIVDFSSDPYTFGLPTFDITIPGTGENVKRKYFDMLTQVQEYLEKFKPDDTDAFVAVIRGLDSLIVPCIESGSRYMVVAQKIKKLTANVPEDVSSLDPKKRYTRFKTVIRTYSLHLKRVRAAACNTWTESHLEVLQKLFSLCVNRYAKVRGIAQQRYCRYLDWSSGFLCRYVTSYMLEKLQEGVPHHEYKGTLYVLQSSKCSPILINSWEQLSRIWMALLRSPFSEKNSIILCMHHIQRIIARDFIFFPFEDRVPANSQVNRLAKELLKESQWKELEGKVPNLDMSRNVGFFNQLVDGLLEFGPSSNCHWRKQLLSSEMLSVLVVQEVPIRVDVINFFFKSLVSQFIDIQRIGLAAVPWILSLFKRYYPSYTVNTSEGIKLSPGETIRSVLQYRSKPSKRNYMLKALEDPLLKIPPPNELMILKICRINQKLLELWSIEDKTKGIGSKRTSFAKLVARNNGPEALALLLELLLPMTKDKDQWKQRCVSNIFGGVLYGMKLWSDEKIQIFWKFLLPVINDCLNNVTQETYDYWIAAMSLPLNNRDGNKMRFFVKFLQERFVNSLESAQTTSVEAHNNMSFFELAVTSLQWRGGDLFIEVLEEISKFFLETPIPYRNVRVQLGRLLGNVYEWNVESALEFGVDLQAPCDQFLSNTMLALKDIVPESMKFQVNEAESEENAGARNLLLKFKTVLEWINCVCWDVESTIHSKFYGFIPWLCYFESYDPDPEISHLSTVALAGLSKHLIRPEHMDTLLNSLNEAASSASWKARLCVLEFLKVFAISNASIIASNEEWANRVVDLVLKLLAERKLEVRELASRILCGFLHCLLIPKPMELLKKFKDEVDRSMKKKKLSNKGSGQFGPEDVDRAHSAILGVCSFVDTHPYDVPEFLPDVLVYLTTHLNDCQPIPV
ncbi:unnamed protein product, partial [Allacma fusca]